MAHEDVDRLTADLSTIRQAMQFDKPYAARDVQLMLLMALGGFLSIPLVEFTQWNNRVCLLLALTPLIVQYCRTSAQRRKNCAVRPRLWQEMWHSLVAAVIMVPLVIGWLVWNHIAGVPRLHAGGSAVFFIGAGLAVIGTIDANRRSYLAASIGMLAYGLAIPLLSPQQVPLGGAIVLIVSGLGGAGVICWQLKRDTAESPGNEPR